MENVLGFMPVHDTHYVLLNKFSLRTNILHGIFVDFDLKANYGRDWKIHFEICIILIVQSKANKMSFFKEIEKEKNIYITKI